MDEDDDYLFYEDWPASEYEDPLFEEDYLSNFETCEYCGSGLDYEGCPVCDFDDDG